MQNSQLDRLLKLAKRTGDRIIVTANDGEEPVVILPLAEYEGMLDAMGFFREEAHDHVHGDEGGAHAHAHHSHDHGHEEEEADFDPVALERQVMAAMGEEPEVVPVEPVEVGQSQAPVSAENERKPIVRREKPQEESSEERFYLEPV